MFPFLIPLLIGAAGGALTNKKDPLKGLLMGGALGATGGLLAPAALGALGAAGAAGAEGAATAGAATAGVTGAEGAFLGEGAASGIPAWDAAATTGHGFMEGGKSFLSTASEYMKPASQASSLAQQAGLLGPREQPQASPTPMPQPGGGAQTLASIAQMASQQGQLIDQEQELRRRKRLGLLDGGMA